ncbi:MAG: type VI secretion system amidase effector protein Tae4 [Acidobacteriota bacterium]|nr:type VI secretion system amidase effector protein Tae4 [Acidobacteriota bacterium]
MPKKLPNFDELKKNYLTGSKEDVKTTVGGEVNADYIDNTCVIRVSRALDYANDPIVRMPGVLTVKGADKKLYALRVREFRKYMVKTYGKPAVDEKKAANGSIPMDKFSGKRGIIGFEVKGWSDATGHFSLWDGTSILYDGGHDYFGGLAYEAMLWEAP